MNLRKEESARRIGEQLETKDIGGNAGEGLKKLSTRTRRRRQCWRSLEQTPETPSRLCCRVHVMYAFARFAELDVEPREFSCVDHHLLLPPGVSSLCASAYLTTLRHRAYVRLRKMMPTRLRTNRSTETPMDFEFTSRPSSNTKPAWATAGEDPHTPRKRE